MKVNNSYRNRLGLLYGVIIMALLSQGCKEDSSINPDSFNTGIQGLAYLTQPEAQLEPTKVEVVEELNTSGDFECSTIRYKAAPEYNEMLLLDPTSDIIYPGSVLIGESVGTGEYIPIIAARKPLTLSVSLQNIAGSPTATIDNPVLSNIRAATNEILSAEVTGATAAKVSFEIEEIFSHTQLTLALGANYQNSVAEVSGKFDFTTQETKSRFVVKFLQAYYTIDIDLPGSPSDLFSELPDLSKLGDVSPMYVSTITYGRMVIFTAESESTSTEMRAALAAAFDSGVSSGSVDIAAGYKDILESSKISANVVGGSGEDASGIISGIDGLTEYITNGGNYSLESPASPLSYKLRYLSDNSVGNIVLATEYNVRQCQRIVNSYNVVLKKLVVNGDNGGDNSGPGDWTGFFYARSSQGGGNVRIWTRTQTLELDADDVFNIEAFKSFTFTRADGADYIEIGGELTDADGLGGDNFVKSSSQIRLNQIVPGREFKLNFLAEHTNIDAVFTFEANN